MMGSSRETKQKESLFGTQVNHPTEPDAECAASVCRSAGTRSEVETGSCSRAVGLFGGV